MLRREASPLAFGPGVRHDGDVTKHSGGLSIAARTSLPLDAVTQKFAFLGISGSGKTYAAAVVVEAMIKARLPVIVVDPVGVWWGLRTSADGKGDGLPVVIFGGRKGDLPIDATMGPALADVVMETGVSVVLDVSDLDDDDQRELVAGFAEQLYRLNRNPVHVVLDEADVFGPQQRDRGQRRTIRAINNLVRRGRARGIGVTMITQRPAVLDKDLLTQAEVLFAFRLVGPPDQAAVESWIRHNCTAEQRDDFLGSLASLPTGTAWLISPSWLQRFAKIRVRQRETFDSSSTPTTDIVTATPRALRDVNLEELRGRFAAALERTKDTDPAVLRRRIEELEKQIARRPRDAKPVTVTVPALTDADRKLAGELLETIAALRTMLEQAAGTLFGALGSLASPAPPASPAPEGGGSSATPPQVGAVPTRRRKKGGRLDGRLRMLEVMARVHPVALTRRQLGSLAGYVATGRTFRDYLGDLRREGLVRDDSGDKVALTDAGAARATQRGFRFGPVTAAELQEMWLRVLGHGPAKMLGVLLARAGHWMPRTELAAKAGYEVAGRTFRDYLGVLRMNGLADEQQDSVRASSWISASSATK